MEILSSEVTCPCPGAVYMFKIVKKIYVKSSLQNLKDLMNSFIFISHQTLVAGYYVFRLAVCVSVHLSFCPSVRSPYIPTLFPFDNLSIYKQISFKFCICICTKNVSLGIVNGQISIIYHRVMAFVNGQKMVFGL